MRTSNALLLSCLLFGSVATATAADRRVHQVVDLAATGRLAINTHNGTVFVTTWNQPRVEIDARIEPGEFSDSGDVDKVEIKISGSRDNVRIETNYDALDWTRSWFSVTRTLPLVHYRISMPATASLDVDDHNAEVRISELKGDLRVHAHNGRVDINGHSGGASVDVHNASVRVAFRDFVKAADIHTHNGSVDVLLPATARFHLDADGHHLGLDSEFPLSVRRSDRDNYIADVNGGGAELRVSTHNGSLRLKRM